MAADFVVVTAHEAAVLASLGLGALPACLEVHNLPLQVIPATLAAKIAVIRTLGTVPGQRLYS